MYYTVDVIVYRVNDDMGGEVVGDSEEAAYFDTLEEADQFSALLLMLAGRIAEYND